MGICSSVISSSKIKKQDSLTKDKNIRNEINLSTDSIKKIKDLLNGIPDNFKESNTGKIDEKSEEKKNKEGIKFELVRESNGDPLAVYSIERPLFESNTGVMWLAKHKLTQMLRTMKIINKRVVNENSDLILRQVNVLKGIDHPNIVKIFEFFNTKDKLYIIQEHGQGGQLMDYIIDNTPLDEFTSAYIIYQILYAMNYCHGYNTFHLDLKPDNILIDYISNGLVHIKIMDFGSSQIIEKEITKNTDDLPLSSLYFTAPEGLTNQYSNKSDLWSVGVILYLLLSGRVPFMGEREKEVIEKIDDGAFELRDYPWNKISIEAKDLIKKLLDIDMESRINANTALSHNWFMTMNIREKTLILDKEIVIEQIENMKNYAYKMSLQDAVLSFLVHNSLHIPQIRDSCTMFSLFDINNDGVVSHDELTEGIRTTLDINEDEAKELSDDIIEKVDINKVGYIEYEQFIKASIDKEKLLEEDILKYAFNYFDIDKSGIITIEELKLAFTNKGNQEYIEDMINEIDDDGNGEIDFSKFTKMMRSIIH